MSKKLVIAILALFMAGIAFAQVSSTSKMEGKVVDSTGAPLPGVSIEATSPKLVGKSTAVTDGDGTFRLFSLPSGTYEVIFTLQGFKTLIRKDVIIQMSQTITLNVSLDQAALEESVTVVGQSPLIDVKSTVKGMTMTKEVFMSLPRSRNFDGLLSTVPGVQYDNKTGGLSVDGATGTENMWYMDGTDVTGVRLGTLGQGAVMELVEEVKVTASGYTAEFGGSMGGVVNVITRSGGNAFHGDILGYFNNNSRFMQGKARDYIRWSPTNSSISEYVNDDTLYWKGGYDRSPYMRTEGVFNLGGYILKDKLWFFGSLNPVYASQTGRRFFNTDPVPRPEYKYFRKDLALNGQIKLTAAPFKGMRMSASFVNNWSNYRGAIPSILGSSSKTYAWGAEGFDYPNMSGAFMLDYSLSNNLLISARGGYSMQNTVNQQIANRFTTYYFNYENLMFSEDPFFAANPSLLRLGGAVNYAGSRTVNDRQKQEKYSSNVDLTYYLSAGGEHAFKFGGQLIRDQEDYLNGAVAPMVDINWDDTCTALMPYGSVDFGNEAFRGDYGYYMVRGSVRSDYGSAWKIHRNSYAIYAQDSWTIGGKLTINAGVRTESEYIPSFNTNVDPQYLKPIKFGFGDKLAPRLGVVYDVFGDSSLKVFASYGIYYDVMKLYMAEGAFGGFKWQTDYYTLDNPDYRLIAPGGTADLYNDPAHAGAGRYEGTIDWRLPSFDTTDPNLKPVAQREISFGADKKLSEDLSVSARGVWKHLIRTIEDIGFITPEGELYYNGNPGSQYIQDALLTNQGPGYWPEPKATREYYGLNLQLEKRFSHNWQGGINYTLSLTKGNYGGLSSSDEATAASPGRNSPNVERSFDLWFMMYDMTGKEINGPLPQDRTHYFKAYGSYSFPIGLTVGVVAYGRSGNPVSTQLSFNNSYIYPNGYNDLPRLPFTMWADIYAEWAIKISGKYTVAFNAQINNVTNTKTWQYAVQIPARRSMTVPDSTVLTGTFNYLDAINAAGDPYWYNIQYGQYSNRFGTWSARFGARFSF
ncbi:MAG: TonB-dependent receptor [Candidatus Aminicenantes bacterium]|nr:TonB-dependent receptor [Candidatus Aminicenantes bacterium]